MATQKFSDEEKVTILKKVGRKANQYYQDMVHVDEEEEADKLLEEELNNL